MCYFQNSARLTRSAVVKNVGAKPMRLECSQIHGWIQSDVIGADDGRIAVSHQHVADGELGYKLLVIWRLGNPTNREGALASWRHEESLPLNTDVLNPIKIMM